MAEFEPAGMRTLLLMRHAKSSWDNPRLSDHDRRLNERGLRDAPQMGRLITEQQLRPSLIVSSTAIRARETAEHVAESCQYSGDILLEPRLYHASTRDWKEVLRELPDSEDRVLCVGHNPGLEELLMKWTSETVDMPTAALAVVELHVSHWTDLDRKSASMSAVFRPKEQFDRDSA